MRVIGVMLDLMIVALRGDSLNWFWFSVSSVLNLVGSLILMCVIVIMMMEVIVMVMILRAGFA